MFLQLATYSLVLREVGQHLFVLVSIKCVVSRYMQKDSAVYGCFLDASKAFVLVNHEILFKRLIDKKLPTPVLRLLMAWYPEQRMRVKINGIRRSQTLFLFPMV